VVEVARLDDVVPGERLLGLDGRPVGDLAATDRLGGGRRLQRLAADDLAAEVGGRPW
jgi:hypothetical protein